MSFKRSAAHTSGIKKRSKPAAFKRSSSGTNPYSSLGRSKSIPRLKSSASTSQLEEEEDFLSSERLDDIGLIQALSTDLTLRDVPQAILYIRGKMWAPMPEQRTGMNSERIAEVLNFRLALPPLVTVSHLQALLNSATAVEKEIAELVRGGAIRKIVVGGRGNTGEVLMLVRDLEEMVGRSAMEDNVKERFLGVLKENPTAVKFERGMFAGEDAKALMRAGFLTSATASWTTTDAFSRPAEGSRGTMTSINSISRAASGSMAAVGGDGAVHAAGGSGGGAKSFSGVVDFSMAIPTTGPFLKLVTNARAHFISLLSKSRYREAPEHLLRQRWDGGIAVDDAASEARRNRGEFSGVSPGRTRKWKLFYGATYEWILGECVGAGLVEVFDTGSVGRGVRAL
ncbi:hypothetical protein LSUB1_G008423 [Lachnellula subtilissima]|uniref:Serine-threonine protein kinase 19 n=1 Tax=Lachnellula subtilissima TaxID=602034 RepID=A0A8H8RDZ9_9HELO|nr:hypothetical protein LSUB1_G008423 [Lachnellula subtilissima]